MNHVQRKDRKARFNFAVFAAFAFFVISES